jgi:RHS repeat-associated protein
MALVDLSGAVLKQYNYDVFGAIRSGLGSQANAWTFTGEQTDATTGLEYLRARYYDSATGRFISKDPAGTGYRYGRSNPVSLADPSCLYELCGEDETWGYICYDSTQVGLPADPPSS